MNAPHHPSDPPSSLGLTATCPGSRTLRQKAKAQGLDVNVYADEAEEGTDLHILARPGVPLEGVKPELAALAQKARDYGEHHAAGAEWVAYEQRLTLWGTPSSPAAITWGTADRLHRHPGFVRILEFKFGWGDLVETLALWQTMVYAGAAMQRERVDRAEVLIFHVRTGEEYFGGYCERDIPAKVAGVICHALDHHEDYRPGPWCRYCPAKGICPAFTEEALAVTRRDPLELADPVALNRVLDICTAVEALGPALRKRLVEMVRAGELVIPGREIRATKTREITDLPGLLSILAEVGCTQEDWLPALRASLPALEKLYTDQLQFKRMGGMSKKAAAEMFDAAAAPFVETGERCELRKTKGVPNGT